MPPIHRHPLQPLNQRLQSFEAVMVRPASTLTFLVIRFVLMSGLVVGFSWWTLHLSP